MDFAFLTYLPTTNTIPVCQIMIRSKVDGFEKSPSSIPAIGGTGKTSRLRRDRPSRASKRLLARLWILVLHGGRNDPDQKKKNRLHYPVSGSCSGRSGSVPLGRG